MKELLAITSILLIIAAYLPYIRDVIAGKTKPHPYTWFVSGLVTVIAFGLQLSHGAGWGMLPTLVGAIAGLIIFALSLVDSKGAKITRSDTLFFIMALIAVGLWLIARLPLVSSIIISIIEILAFIPTYRKSWSHPRHETVSAYAINIVRHSLAIIALRHYSLVTMLYPMTEALADTFFTLLLIARRSALEQ